MLNKLRKSNEGFTIIEVMIVLAIAGLIILIVLLAVPALQRNSRNAAIKNDASAVAGGISTFEADYEGKTPSTVATTAGLVDITDAAGDKTTAKVQGGTDVAPILATGTTPTQALNRGAGNIDVQFGKTCSTATGGAGTASTRAFSVYYVIESSSGTFLRCLDS